MIGPDNGLLAPAVAMAGGAERAVVLTNPEYQLEAAGATFAGRDVFAPAAAHVCNGVDLAELGPEIDPVLLLPGTVPLPREDGDAMIAEVLWVDRFGNCQLNVGPDDLPADVGPASCRSVSGADRPVRRHVRRRAVARSSFADLGGWRGRPRARLVRDAGDLSRPALGRRRARSRRRRPGDDRARSATSPAADDAGRPSVGR